LFPTSPGADLFVSRATVQIGPFEGQESYPMKKLLALTLIAVLSIGMTTGTAASELTLLFSGLDLYYDGSNISTNGADNLATMVWAVDANPTSSWINPPTNITADVMIEGVGQLNEGINQFVPTAGPKFNLAFNGWSLDLNWDSPVTISFSNGNMTIEGSATTNTITGGNVPIDVPVVISLSTQIQEDQYYSRDQAGNLTGFHSFGTGEVSGPLVPEPATLMLLGAGLLGGGAAARRRRKAAEKA
jgi:hypothetical protein